MDEGRVRVRRALWRSYEIGWQLTTGVAVVVGLGAVVLSPFGLAPAAGFAIVVVATISWLLWEFDHEFGVRRALWVSTRSVVGAIAALGLIGVLGGAGFAVAVLLTASSPKLVRRLTGWEAPPARPVPVSAVGSRTRVIAGGDLAVTDGLTEEDLCLAWRSSFVALSRAPGDAARLRTVETRAVILDELERRDGNGLRAWLTSGARAASDPRSHLARP